jgi:hypothetical protein
MNKPVVFLKSHVDTFTRKDGVVVQAHDTKVQAHAAPVTRTQNEGRGFHGAAMDSHRYETHGPDGDARSEAEHRDQYKTADEAFSRTAHALVQGGHFSKHEHARDYLDSVDGRHLGDAVGHRGDISNVKWLGRSVKKFKDREGIKDAPAAAPAAAPAGVHHSELREGDQIEGPDGAKHEYSHTERGLGRMVVHTAAGHTIPTGRDGALAGFKKTGTNFADPAPAAAPARPSAGLADAGYDRPAHVKTKEDEHHYLSSIPPEQRSAAHKARLKKIFSQGGLGKHSPEYKAHLAAAKPAAKRAPAKPKAAASKVQKTGANIGAGSWSKGHQVKIHAPGHELHAKAGEITGPDTKSPGRVVVKHGDGTAHSVHFSDLRPADGHSWPQ